VSVLGTTRASRTGPEKTESASEAKIHQAINGQHVKECNLTDLLINAAWSGAEGRKGWSYTFILFIYLLIVFQTPYTGVCPMDIGTVKE
jgi:hypothetical protein